MKVSRRSLYGYLVAAPSIAAFGQEGAAVGIPGDSTAFWEFHADAWLLDSISDSAGKIEGSEMHAEYEWPSRNQRGGLPYASDPIVFRNWELEHPAIRRWRLNTNSIRILAGTASGRNLERIDPDSNRSFFEIDNSTRYLGAEARYWFSPNLFVEAGVVASHDSFNGREDVFVHERLYNDLTGAIAWTPAELRIDAQNSVMVGPQNASGVFSGPSRISGASYTFRNVGQVTVFAPNANDLGVSVVNAGPVDVDAPNGDAAFVATDNTGPVTISVANGDSLFALARRARSFEIDAPNGDGLRAFGVETGNVDVSAPNGDNFQVLVVDAGNIVVEAANGRDGRVEALRSGTVAVTSGGVARVASEASGATTTVPVASVGGSVSSAFVSEIADATSRLPQPGSDTGAAVSVDLPICSLSVQRSSREVRLTAGNSAALDGCVNQLLVGSDAAGFVGTNSIQSTFFDDDSDETSAKARIGYRGTRFLLGRLPHPIVESISGGLTFEASPQGNGIGRAGSWFDASYAVGVQLHSNPRRDAAAEQVGEEINSEKIGNPFPRLVEFRTRYVREVTEFKTSWTEGSISLHGSFGLRNPDSSSKIRHYSIGLNYIEFSESREDVASIDFRLNHREKGFGFAYFSVDLMVFRESAIKLSYTGSKVEFEGLRSNWQDRLGLTWRGHL